MLLVVVCCGHVVGIPQVFGCYGAGQLLCGCALNTNVAPGGHFSHHTTFLYCSESVQLCNTTTRHGFFWVDLISLLNVNLILGLSLRNNETTKKLFGVIEFADL